MNVAKLSALRTGWLYLPGNTPGTNLKGVNRPHDQSGAGRIMSMKISNDTPNTPSEIEPATSRLEVQCLNHLRHRVPLRPYFQKSGSHLNTVRAERVTYWGPTNIWRYRIKYNANETATCRSPNNASNWASSVTRQLGYTQNFCQNAAPTKHCLSSYFLTKRNILKCWSIQDLSNSLRLL